MKFLIPVGGVVDYRFGILTTPAHQGIPIGIKNGMEWAADNGVYSGIFDPEKFLSWLDEMNTYRDTCLFVTVPDVVGNAQKTIEAYKQYAPLMRGWPLAFVAQDGQENLAFPGGFDVLFVGGSTVWKVGDGAKECIRRAVRLGKRVHIGRVNWWKRYKHFADMEGSYEFTCDGTRTRYDGVEKTLAAWAGYRDRVYGRDCCGK